MPFRRAAGPSISAEGWDERRTGRWMDERLNPADHYIWGRFSDRLGQLEERCLSSLVPDLLLDSPPSSWLCCCLSWATKVLHFFLWKLYYFICDFFFFWKTTKDTGIIYFKYLIFILKENLINTSNLDLKYIRCTAQIAGARKLYFSPLKPPPLV